LKDLLKFLIKKIMRILADFHIHSRFSRATSQAITVENLAKWAKIKGINIVGTGDFTHPQWLKELKENLVPAERGLYVYKNDEELLKNNNQLNNKVTRFVLTAETSHIYTKNNRGRRIHLLVLVPSFETVDKINTELSWTSNLSSDGRPILGMNIIDFTKLILTSDENCLIIPAHIWTPWYSIFGSMSGFDSLEEAFEEMAPYIFAIETGLSSDPLMNWRLSNLDKVYLVSNSDAHSLEKIAREANVFELEKLDYFEILGALKDRSFRNQNKSRLIETLEFYPEEGKYHFDGHRLCNISFSPKETKAHNGICPVCNKPLTIGVLNRVEALADREEGFIPENAIPFKSLIPLEEIIAQSLKVNSKTKKVSEIYFGLCEKFNGELNILLNLDLKELENEGYYDLALGINKMRKGEVIKIPGYDGEYGKIKVFEENFETKTPQTSLF